MIEANKVVAEMTPWEFWIFQHFAGVEPNKSITTYDLLCELAVSSYNLKAKTRAQDDKDRVHYLLMWWMKRKVAMKKYRTTQQIAGLLNQHYSTVLYYVNGHRKKSSRFDENVKCIKDFLKS